MKKLMVGMAIAAVMLGCKSEKKASSATTTTPKDTSAIADTPAPEPADKAHEPEAKLPAEPTKAVVADTAPAEIKEVKADCETDTNCTISIPPATISIDLVEEKLVAGELSVAWGKGATHTLAIKTPYSDCENSGVFLAPVRGVDAGRVVSVLVMCREGEDIFSNNYVAALVAVGTAITSPTVLWSGKNAYSSEMGDCVKFDSVAFEAGADSQIRVLRKKGTLVEDAEEVPDCKAVPVVTTEEGLVPIS